MIAVQLTSPPQYALAQAAPTTTPSRGPAVMLGVAGLILSAGIMIAMGFHKPGAPRRRRR